MQKNNYNILIWYLGRKGGGAKEALEVARAFKQLDGYNAFVALSNENELYDETVINSCDSFCISTFPNIIGLACNIIKIPLYRLSLKHFLQQNSIDLVYCIMGNWFDNFLLPVIFSLSIPCAYTVHDAIKHVGEADRKYFNTISRMTGKSSSVVTHSQSVSNQLNEILPVENKMVTVPLGTFQYNNQQEPRHLIKNHAVHLLFFGRIEEYKGLDITLQAFQLLQEHGYNVCLDIYGNGDITKYKDRIDNTDNISCYNRWIDEGEIPQIFIKSDIVVLSYIEASQSGVIPIAIGFGVPSVCTPVGGLTEQISKYMCGRVGERVDASSLAKEIEYLIDHDDEYYKLSCQCIENSKKYSWNGIVLQLIEKWKDQGLLNEK